MSMLLRAWLAAAALLAASSTAGAHELSDNLSAPPPPFPDNQEFVSPTDWVAAAFATDSQAWSLTSVVLPLSFFPTESVVMTLCSSTGAGLGQPGATLATLTLAKPFAFDGQPTLFLADGVVLDPSTTYWIVLRAEPGSAGSWSWTTSEDGEGVGFLHTWGRSPDAGGLWLVSDTDPLYMQVNAEPAPWASLGSALAGTDGAPLLDAEGPLVVGSSGVLTLASAAPAAPAFLFVSTSSTPTAFKGGTLVTVPITLAVFVPTSGAGGFELAWSAWPAGLSGTTLYFQAAIPDVEAIQGVALSNGMSALVP